MNQIICGYSLQEELFQSSKSRVYRAVAPGEEGRTVILKLLREDYPSPEEQTRYRREFEITRSLQIPGAARALALEKYNTTMVMVIEDIGATSLTLLMDRAGGPIASIDGLLTLAIGIATCLGELHAHDVIHKDINPSNVVLNPKTGAIQLIDFGISTKLSRQNPTLKSTDVIEGTLAYMSPEQTGRMNRSLDYRTDFYSLGATLYHLFTGALPFTSDDRLMLVHAHLAMTPQAPHERNRAVPEAISRVIMKLMAKNAEQRYQSAAGLRADLERCRADLRERGEVESFDLGLRDISDRFQIPEKLYGRGREIDLLLQTFERVAGPADAEGHLRNAMILIAGRSGIGKTVLVHEVHRPITRASGYFIAGKFDQLQRDIPYSALVRALSDLVGQLLTESEERLERWRATLLKALGRNGQIIIEVIPEVQLIVGPQPPVEPLGPADARNRFNLVFQNFIGVFSTPEHPLVLFLDDLQWADTGTLELLRLIMQDTELSHLLLIGAYRDNEVNAAHPFMAAVEDLRKAGTNIREMTLAPLPLSVVTELVADALHTTPAKAAPLAEIVVGKTQGSPFFTNEFLKTLYEERVLSFSPGDPDQPWRWDIDRVATLGITDNVVDLLINKLRRLPESAQQALRLAACIGNRFDLETLATIEQRSLGDTFSTLMPAIQQDLIVPLSELVPSDDSDRLLAHKFRFQHDRVQQASYSLISVESRAEVHLTIGRLLLAKMGGDVPGERLFDIVNQLNEGRALIDDPEERAGLTRLNLKVGLKAIEAAAYSSAARHLGIAKEFLPDDGWTSAYELTFQVHKELVRSLYLSGVFDQTDALYAVLLGHVRSNMDTLAVYDVQMEQYILQGNNEGAIAVQRKGLALLGIEVPKEPAALAALLKEEIAAAAGCLGDRKVADLIHQPEVTSEEQLAALRILKSMWLSAYSAADHTLLFYSAVKVSNYSLVHGRSEIASFAYLQYGFACVTLLDDPQTAYEFGSVAIRLSNMYDNIGIRGTVHIIFGAFINHWVRPLASSLPYYRKGFLDCVETGNWSYAAFGALHFVADSTISGRNCHETLEHARSFASFLRRNAVSHHDNFMVPAAVNPLLDLIGETAEPGSFDAEGFVEDRWVKSVSDQAFILGWYYPPKVRDLYLFGRHEEGLALLHAVDVVDTAVPGQPKSPEIYFLMSLMILARIPAIEDAARRAELLARVDAFHAKMCKWESHCAENFQHKRLLIEAERARVMGDSWSAVQGYQKGIAAARDSDHPQNEALGRELFAKFWLEHGEEQAAVAYMNEAVGLYRYWGALAKAEHLRAKYPKLVRAPGAAQEDPTTISSTSPGSAHTALDFATLMKVTRAISREIVLEKLLENLMRILIENAGAQLGYLLLSGKDDWRIEAAGAVDREEVAVLQSLPIESESKVRLPKSVLNYAIRSQNIVLLDDASASPKYASDPYVVAHKPKSVLCCPLISAAKVIGLVYFENNLTTGTFTAERVELLRLLSGQVAISLANALSYRNVEDLVAARTSELAARNVELREAIDDLRRTQKRLVQSEKMAAMGRLTMGIAHEIRNPLNFVKNFSEIGVELASELDELRAQKPSTLLNDVQDLIGDFKVNAEKVHHHGLRAETIVDSMLRHAGRTTGERTKTPLNSLVAEAVRLVESDPARARAQGATAGAQRPAASVAFEREFAADAGEITIVPQDIQRVLLALFDNALDGVSARAMAGEKTFRPVIRVSTHVSGGSVCVRVEDNGAGIDPAIQDRIFEPFFTTKPTSRGLGLSLAYDVVVSGHDGTLAVESAPGGGAAFLVTLPRDAAPKPS